MIKKKKYHFFFCIEIKKIVLNSRIDPWQLNESFRRFAWDRFEIVDFS